MHPHDDEGKDMHRRIVLATIDGGGVDYFDRSDIPNIRAMMRNGFYVEGSSMIPSVTNVNNVSIVTGQLPSEHGITSNYWYSPQTGEGVFMESPEYLLIDTIFERIRPLGLRSCLLTSKDKLKRILETGTEISFSAEYPPEEYQRVIGPAEKIYSAEINHWLFRSLRHLLAERRDIDIFYVSTTDYIMHRHAPEEEASMHHLAEIDRLLGIILDENPDLEIYLTADHGMSPKRTALNLASLLAEEGIESVFVPAIKDRYVLHHDNLGGVGYLHVISRNRDDSRDEGRIREAMAILGEIGGVEEVYDAPEAAQRFGLLKERIGDIMVLGEADCVFGDIEGKECEVDIRSHGSRYESRIPIIGYNSPLDPKSLGENRDIVKNLSRRWMQEE